MSFFLFLAVIYAASAFCVIGCIAAECYRYGFSEVLQLHRMKLTEGLPVNEDHLGFIEYAGFFVIFGWACQTFLPIINTHRALSI